MTQKVSLKLVIIIVTAFTIIPHNFCIAGKQANAGTKDQLIWFNTPARSWQEEALPIGNGRLGGMIFGGVARERIQFNEDSQWVGDEKDVGAYQAFGDLYIDFRQNTTEYINYKRSLNISDGIHRISYIQNGVKYHREYFASYPAGIMVFRFTADQKGAFTGTIQLTDMHDGIITALANHLTSVGSLPGQGSKGLETSYWVRGDYDISLDYEAKVLVLNDGGKLITEPNGRISFRDCDGLSILLAAGTDYLNQRSSNWKGEHPHNDLSAQLEVASGKSFKELRKEHIQDYQNLFNRFSLDIGKTQETTLQLPTNERIASYKQEGSDPDLEELIFQYARYLMISSSRPGTLPATLQGIWNDSNNPIWECDLHTNVNLQMNYWFVHPANLTECFQPLAEWINSIREIRKEETRKVYRTRGWAMHSKNNIFGGSTWRWSNGDAAWLAQNLWSHYLFTLDKDYLRTRAFPVMKELCEFWVDNLKEVPDDYIGDWYDPERSKFWKDNLMELSEWTLICPDGWSPEQKHIQREDGVSYDQQLVWDLFNNYVEAARIMGEDDEFYSKISNMRDRLLGPRIGKWGQLQEWMVDRDDPDDQHRHLSHMIAIFPGQQISPITTPELAQAAKVSMNARGDGAVGWSKAWKINIWARLHDGDHAYNLISGLISNNYYDNLFSYHPPFMIDANFGYASGVCEMLLQSHLGEIFLLPALPGVWSEGEVKGIRARGGFEIDIKWKEGNLSKAAIRSLQGSICRLRTNVPIQVKHDGKVVEIDEVEQGVIAFATEAGQEYSVTNNYKQ